MTKSIILTNHKTGEVKEIGDIVESNIADHLDDPSVVAGSLYADSMGYPMVTEDGGLIVYTVDIEEIKHER